MQKQISAYMPVEYLALIEHLIAEGLYPNRNELIRLAVRDLLMLHKGWDIEIEETTTEIRIKGLARP